MNALLVYVDSETSSGFTTGLGLASISSYVRKFGHKTGLVYFKSEADLDYALDKGRRFAPGLIGFYATSVGVETVKSLSRHFRGACPEAFQIFGGIHATLCPEVIMEMPDLDAVCQGFGEVPLLRCLDALKSGRPGEDVPGLWLRKPGGGIAKNAPYFPDLPPEDFLNFDHALFLDEMARFPDFDRGGYRLEVIFNRVCPFQCAFCCNASLRRALGTKPYVPSPEASLACLERAVKSTGLGYVEIHDDILTLHKSWFKPFIQGYAERIGLPFSCNLRVGCFDEEDVLLLRQAGVDVAWIGLESGNDSIRNGVMNKNTKRKDYERSFSWLHMHGVKAITQNILGVPGETPELFLDTIRLNAALAPLAAMLSVFYPYPKTELGEYCREQGLISDFGKDFVERCASPLELAGFPAQDIDFFFGNFQALLRYEKTRLQNPGLNLSPLALDNCREIAASGEWA